ncbi:MAG: hypothetical protein JNM95_02115 [Chitinophagaceae bacterium]|nr:hypothetical protein [Chitinophagaceae bacterium]
MKIFSYFILLALYSISAEAQWDVVFSTEGIGSLHKIRYYRIQQTDFYLKSDQFFGTFNAGTIEPRYQLQFNERTSIGIGLPIGFSSYSSEDMDMPFSYHIHAMMNISGGIFAQRWSEPDYSLKRFGYYVGLGPGFYGCNATPSITEVVYDKIPVGSDIVELGVNQGSNFIYSQTPSLKSFGLQVQAGVCFNWYGYKLLPLFYLPTGIRASFHKALDSGGDFYTVGVIFNSRVWWGGYRHFRSRYTGY